MYTQTPFDKDMKKWAKYLINEQNKTADYLVISYLIDTVRSLYGAMSLFCKAVL